MQKEEIVKIVTDLINSKQYDGIWYVIPRDLSNEFFSILKNNYPLESVGIENSDKLTFWFCGSNQIIFAGWSLQITMKFELIPNQKAMLIEIKEGFHP